MPLDFTALDKAPRLLIEAGLAPVQGTRLIKICFSSGGRPCRAADRVTPGKSSHEPPFTTYLGGSFLNSVAVHSNTCPAMSSTP